MAQKQLKKCLTSLVIREMQIKMILIFHLTPIKRAKIKKHLLARMWRKSNTPPLLVELQAGTTTLEII
jgi:DNA polymerase III psi subunit